MRLAHLSIGKGLLVLLTLAALAAAGCAPKLPPEPEWEKDARAVLSQADEQFAKRQYGQAVKTVDSFFTRYPESRHRDRALFLLGEIRLTQRDYPRALSYYKEIIERFPSSPYIFEAKYKLGLCYYELKEYDLAVANLQDRSRLTDPAMLRRAAEMLASAYVIKANYPAAVAEYVTLIQLAPEEKQKEGYRDRIRDLIEKNFSEEELALLARGKTYPSDSALLRLSSFLVEQRRYREALKQTEDFLYRFPGHPETERAKMLATRSLSMLSAPRFHIAVLVPQSGPFAFFGNSVLKGVQLAVHAYNTMDPDNRIELVVKDTEGSPDKAVAALQEASAKGIIASIGPLLTREVEALVPALDRLQVPLITPAASGPDLAGKSPWLFRNALTNNTQAAAAAQYMLAQKYRKIVILAPDDAYGADLSRLLTRELARKAELLATVSYPADANDFGLYIKKIIEIDLRSRKIPIPEDDDERKKLFREYVPGFDAIYIPGYAEKVGLLLPQLAFYNITGIGMIGSNNWRAEELIERAGRHAEGAVFFDGFSPENPDPQVKAVIEAYRSAYQEEIDILAAQAYDAASVLTLLLRDRKDTAALLKEGLLSYRDFPGLSGTATFLPSGEAQKKLFLITIRDGRFVLLPQ